MSVAIAHTMRGGSGAADWPRVTAAEAQAVLRHWGFADEMPALGWHSPRPLSAATIAVLTDRSVFIKRHPVAVRSVAQLEEEHAFMAHLRANGAPVCRVLAASDGHTARTEGPWTYEIHELGAGEDRYRDAVSWSPFLHPDHARAAGTALAQLHAAAQRFAGAPRTATLLVANDRLVSAARPLEALDAWQRTRPALQDYLRHVDWRRDLGAAIAPWHAAFYERRPRLAPLWTHNDLHGSNLLWAGEGSAARVTTVFDFGLCDRTTAIFDLATALERNMIPWLEIHEGRHAAADLAMVTALLGAYVAARPLSALEREALVALLPLVHVDFALSEIDYFHGITRSRENADLAYHAFLLGHCRWFESREGRALLAHVAQQLAVATS
jgi:Ser/Thr protein kinase RdoA (MazF antagonist)